MKEKSKAFNKLFWSLFIFFNIGAFFGITFQLMGFDVSGFSFTDLAYAEVLMSLVIAVLVYFIYRKTFDEDLISFKKDLKANLLKALKFFLILLAIKIAAGIVSGYLSYALEIDFGESENQGLINSLMGSAPVMMLISTAILAPFIEEGIFRLGFKKLFNSKYVFIIVSSLVFGFMHIFPTELALSVALLQSIVYLAMGFALAYMYEETNNIYLVMLVHALNNLFGLLIFLAL